MAVNGCGCCHRRADEVCAAADTLPSLEIPVRGRRATLARRHEIRIHREAHRAAGKAPLEARVEEDAVQALLLRLASHLRRPGDHERRYARVDLPARDDGGRRAEILDPGVRARADEDVVDGDVLDAFTRLEAHVL